VKIILVGTAHPYRGGLASFNERLMREFTKEGHDVLIVNFSLQYPAFLFPGTTQYSDSPPPKDLRLLRLLNAVNPISWLRVAWFIRKEAPDLLLFKYWLPFMAPCFGTVAFFAGWRTRMRRLVILDNIIPHEKRPLDRLLTQFFSRQMDGFVAMSQSVASDLRQFSQKPCVLSPHPLFDNFGAAISKEQARKSFSLPISAKVLLFFGFIRPYKGLDLLLEAMALTRDKNILLIIAGEFYTDAKPYFQLVESLRLGNRIIWETHFIADDEVAKYFCAADLVVQPYRHATQSGVTQIALHFGVPSVVTRVGGLAEMVADGISGYLADPKPAAIADRIDHFFGDPANATQLAKALEIEKSKYLWSVMTRHLIQLANSPKV